MAAEKPYTFKVALQDAYQLLTELDAHGAVDPISLARVIDEIEDALGVE